MDTEAVYYTVQSRLRANATPETTFTVSATMPNGERYEQERYSRIDAIGHAIDISVGSGFTDVSVVRHSDNSTIYRR